jgi:ribosomal protein S18 acetylase RimI-like enzyme
MGNPASGEIQILPMAADLIESFHQCLGSVARERSYLAFQEAPALESTWEFVTSNIAQSAPQFVAVSGGDVVGWCDITPMRLEGFSHRGRLGMGVRRDYRRRGLGERLANRTIAAAVEQGLERIELEVFASNIPAIKLYEKLGFVVEGIRKKARKLDGAYDDILDMALYV